MAKRGRKKKKITTGLKLKRSTIQSIFFIFFLVLAIISVFSFLQTGLIPTQYNLLLADYFGFASVFIPFLLILVAFIFAKIKSPLKEPNVFLGFLIMFISMIALFKQGRIGQFFWFQMFYLFESLPTFLIFSFSFIAGFVILFDTSVLQIIKVISSILLGIKKYTLGAGHKLKSSKKALQKEDAVYVQSDQAKSSPPKDIEKESSKDDFLVGIKPTLRNTTDIGVLSNNALTSSTHQMWQYPPLSLFDNGPGAKADRGDVRKNAQTIEQTLDSFGITARVTEINNSPSVTQYALQVALGTKLAKIISLSNDLAMALAAPGGQIRVEAPIPGRSLVGIEVPNRSLEVVTLRSILDSDVMKQAKSKITIPLGLDVGGHPRVADIAKMPHVLIAGQTGSGKSVCVNSWISTILFRASPEEVKLILIDPKRVELSQYNGIPHLLTPVIVEPDKVISALKWAVGEMERRYKRFTEVGAKNIESYNNMAGFQSMQYVIIFIDELAEIMLYSPAEVEENVCRIAQMARAVGIHLVLATQRPSVNIITGLIKANVPTRMAFAVASMTDSRVILDSVGAEKLLGRGDMLYIPPDLAKPIRIQGTFISDKETYKLIDFLKNQKNVEYNTEIISQPVSVPGSKAPNLVSISGEEHDSMFDEAIKFISHTGKASATLLQRQFKIGYARAARLLDELQQAGIVGPVNGAKPRNILIPHNPPSDNETLS